MKRKLSAGCLAFLVISGGYAAQEKKENPPVTLTLTKVRGVEFFTELVDGPKKVREVILACDVIIDNETGEDITVLSNSSAFDGLSIVLLKEGKELRELSYLHHQSPLSFEKKSYVLKKGKNELDMRFPIIEAPDDWTGLEVRIRGNLPGSKFEGKLASDKKKIERVAELSK
jgi:hypothetical protein